MSDASGDDVVTVRAPRWKRLLLLGAGAVMVGVSIYPIALFDPDDGAAAYGILALGVFGVSFSSFLLVLGAMRLLRPRPTLTLDRRGVTVEWLGLIKWSDVGEVWVREVATSLLTTQRSVAVSAKDIGHLRSGLSGWRRVLLDLNHRFFGLVFAVPGSLAPMPIEDLRDLIVRYRDQYGD
jgi:hypothetical protein